MINKETDKQKIERLEKELAKLKSEAKMFRNMYSPEYEFSFEKDNT